MAYIDTEHLFKCETCRFYRNGKCNTFCDAGEAYSLSLTKIPTADVVPMGEVQEIFKEFDRMLERYGYEPYYTVQDMEIEVNILKEKYTKGGAKE